MKDRPRGNKLIKETEGVWDSKEKE
jgi:hypothetical protein